ncbi:hypothetical protein BDY19DRAFT_928102 [Irpex rosettiformis]|uniref:Uncharacterized protein n=1 Tax=Irpex rosettiformis TaxID=378272 RepID=A0ACB8UCS0_9APHY|nr:hypothetical protein BDY19DRAFT_928102 [Irpex rosettiformis]
MDNSGHENHQNNDFAWQVVVTAPSSPEIQHSSSRIANVDDDDSDASCSSNNTILPPITQPDTLMPTPHVYPSSMPPSAFERLLESSQLPDPGPEYFVIRRELWLTPQTKPTKRAPPSSARTMTAQLQSLLEGPVEDLYKESNWNGGIGKICERILVKKETLSQRLPLRHLIKLLQASWVVEDLWPKGQTVPSSSDEQPVQSACRVT